MLNNKLHLNEDVFQKDTEFKAERDAFGEAVYELGCEDKRVVVLTADFVESVRLDKFKNEIPDRFIEVGIAEQNMASISAGLALSGLVPFMVTHAVFSPYGNWSQIRLSICSAKANVKIVSSHVGFSNAPDGAVAEPLEDIAIMRVLPNITIFSPIDYIQTKEAIREAHKVNGPVYIRICKEKTPVITTDKTPFDSDKALTLIEGSDVTIFSTGVTVYEAMEAAKMLRSVHKIQAEVVALPVLKPVDRKSIIGSVKKTGKSVTLEEHQINGGLGGIVSEILAEELPALNLRIGVNDTFCESGTYNNLKDKYGLSAHHVVNKVLDFMRR